MMRRIAWTERDTVVRPGVDPVYLWHALEDALRQSRRVCARLPDRAVALALAPLEFDPDGLPVLRTQTLVADSLDAILSRTADCQGDLFVLKADGEWLVPRADH